MTPAQLSELSTRSWREASAAVDHQVNMQMWRLAQDDLDPRTITQAAHWKLWPDGTCTFFWCDRLIFSWKPGPDGITPVFKIP